MYRILVPGDGTGTAGLEGAQAWIDGRTRRRENTNMARGRRISFPTLLGLDDILEHHWLGPAERCVPIRANAVLSTMTIDTALNHDSTSVGNPGLDDDDK